MKNIRILLPLIILFAGLFAVINTFGDSYTRINNIDIPFESITMPIVDVNASCLKMKNMWELVFPCDLHIHLMLI